MKRSLVFILREWFKAAAANRDKGYAVLLPCR